MIQRPRSKRRLVVMSFPTKRFPIRQLFVKGSVLLLAFAFVGSIALFTLSADSFAQGSATGAPSWYFTVPKPRTIDKTSFILGLPYIEYSPAERLEVGLHGVKYVFNSSDSYPVAIGVDPILSFAYAYAVWGLPTGGNSDLSVGVKIFPLFLLLGYETQIDEKVSFILEANDGVMAGLRIKVNPEWHVEFGAGVAAYGAWRADPFEHRGIHDYDFESIEFEPTVWAGFGYSDFVGKYSR
jgi:hypothetical protein